ncbi:MAG: class I SAM-dependent methyltransferase [Bacilli bacterium]|nr:class I SAM-dependent methyltransferase [Bacilli bacterium]
MRLDKRLTQIASYVDKGAILVDVGTDHGYLPIYLLLNKKISNAIASDINIEPLNSAKKNAFKYHVNLDCVLSDGLDQLANYHFDTISIAGVGGTLIVEILKKNIALVKNKTLILQPQNNSKVLRKFLIDNNFNIIDESLVEENGIIYFILKVNTQNNVNNYSLLDLMYGKINLEKKQSLLLSLLKQDLNKYQILLNKIPSDNTKSIELSNIVEMIEGYLYEIK